MRRRIRLLLAGLALGCLIGCLVPAGDRSARASPLGQSRTSIAAASRGLHRDSAAPRAAALLRVIFVDVGQGDAIILRQGNWTGLIDGGPSGSGAAISAQLAKSGAKRINTLVITHPHADHIGGLSSIVSQFRPRRVVYAASGTTATWRGVKSSLSRVGATFTKVRCNATLAFGKLKAKVLSPSTICGEANDDSVVLLLNAAGKRFLFTGDLHGSNEDAVGRLCARGPPLYLLKVAHHGSAHSTSIAFLSRAGPKFAVIPVGQNSYGHPSPQTISRLRAQKSRIYSTQKNGTLTVRVANSGRVSWSFSRSTKPVTGSPTVTPPPSGSNPTVYITKTGECYHRGDCRYLSQSKIPIRLKDANAQGYRPCSVCDPPQ